MKIIGDFEAEEDYWILFQSRESMTGIKLTVGTQ
jgi:hypothetical protein